MIRKVEDSDYGRLMTLYIQLHDNPFPEGQTAGMDLRRKILTDERHRTIVMEEGGKIVSSCVCVVILNPTHAQRPYTLIRSVITGSGYRRRGLATTCLHYAKEIAVSENCYKIILLARAKTESTSNFCGQAGYDQNEKTAFTQ